MGSTDKTNENNEKKSVDYPDVNLQQAIPKIIDQSLQGVREDIKNIKEANNDLHLMMRGIDAEIQEIKRVTKGIGHRIEKFFGEGLGAIKKAPKSHIKEISTGLDLLTQIPQHLRDTFETILKRDKGSTALDISLETGKSRSLESDYLNQLEDRGFIEKKRHGKKVLFNKIGEIDAEEEAEISDRSGPVGIVAEKKLFVTQCNNNTNNSHKKNSQHIKSHSIEK